MSADLENTAELPVLDPAGEFDDRDEQLEQAESAESAEPAEPADAHHTDTWIVPRPALTELPDPAAEEARAHFETSVRNAYGQLRETQDLLAAKDDRVRELEHSLQQARETTAQQLAQLRTVHEEFAAAAGQRRAELDVELRTTSAAAEQRADELRTELARARGLLDAAAGRATQLQQALDAREAEGRAHLSVLRDLNAERERNALCLESLHRAESHRQIFHSVVSDLQREIDAQESSLQRLAHELATRDAHAHDQDAELERRAVRIASLEQQASSVAAAAGHGGTALPEPAAADPPPPPALAPPAAVPRAESVTSSALEPPPDSDASAARVRELEADLRAAEDTINRLESQMRSRGARLEELEKANRQWRLTMEEARATSTDTSAALRAARAPPATQERREVDERRQTPEQLEADERRAGQERRAGHEPLPEGATRLLICKDKGREVVHMLGRKTSVGRTPDNDLPIDAKYISRHHAVILAGPVHTVIEDLNSTNGVLVNGQRVARHTLKDGDDVVFGRARYRFAVRRAGEER